MTRLDAVGLSFTESEGVSQPGNDGLLVKEGYSSNEHLLLFYAGKFNLFHHHHHDPSLL